MRVRNRIKLMVDVEKHYFNHKGAITILVGFSFFILSFNVAINAFYCFGIKEDTRNLMSFRYSTYLLASYLAFFIIFRILIRYIGFSYPIVIGFTATSFLGNAISGYYITRAAYNWTLNYLIENPVGFEAYMRRAYSEVISNIKIILLVYLIVSVLPDFRRRVILLGRFWFINLITPLLILPPLVLVILMVPEEQILDYAYKSIVFYITLMAWYTIRYFVKAVYFFLLFPQRWRIRSVRISDKRFRALVNRKPNIFRRYPKMLTEYSFEEEQDLASENTSKDNMSPIFIEDSTLASIPIEVLTYDGLKEESAPEEIDILSFDDNEQKYKQNEESELFSLDEVDENEESVPEEVEIQSLGDIEQECKENEESDFFSLDDIDENEELETEALEIVSFDNTDKTIELEPEEIEIQSFDDKKAKPIDRLYNSLKKRVHESKILSRFRKS